MARTYDLTKLIGTECLLNIVESKVGDKTYYNISACTPLMRGQKIPDDAPKNPQVVFSLGDNRTFELLPKWIQGKVLESQEMLPPKSTNELPF